jgi:hypothetical protein
MQLDLDWLVGILLGRGIDAIRVFRDHPLEQRGQVRHAATFRPSPCAT